VPSPLRLGIALSGGGHRATAWGLGVLGAVVDAGLAKDTVSIASVSGGSIANAAAATRGDFAGLDRVEEYAGRVAPTLRVVARTGLFLPGRPTSRYVDATLAALGLWAAALIALVSALGAVARGEPLWPFAVVGAVLGVFAALCGLRIGRLDGTSRLVVPLAGAVLGAAVAVGAAAEVRDLRLRIGIAVLAVLVVVAALLGVLALRFLAKRGEAVCRALARQLSPDGGDPLLRSIESPVNHVFCTTDVEHGDCLFFAPAFVFGSRRGVGRTKASSLTVAQVVQASAAVPPGFPPVFLPVPRPTTEPPEDSVLVPVSDGGVYDVLGDEWETSFAHRLRHHPELHGVQEPATLLLVADASPPFGQQPYRRPGLLTADLLGWIRNVDVMWSATTKRRLHDLREQFRPDRSADGALVSIQESPLDICTAARAYGGGVAERADEAERFLKDWKTPDEWEELAAACAAVPTTLGPLSVRVTLGLLELGYTATLVALYVGHDIGSLKRFPREIFEAALTQP
jgi:predicted acylesterase/phospholipase RssA